MTMKNAVLKNVIQGLTAVAFMLGVWWIAYGVAENPLVVPSPWKSLWTAVLLFGKGAFYYALWTTFLRVVIAFLVAFVFGSVFALISYLYPVFGGFLGKTVAFLRSLPVLAVLLILLVWFGADKAPVAVSFLSLFPILYSGFLSGLKELDPSLAEMGRAYGVPLKTRVWKWYLPALAPYGLRESGSATSFALKLTVSAEILANTYRSLGGMMQEARTFLDGETLFALVIVTFLLATAVEGVFSAVANAVERRVK